MEGNLACGAAETTPVSMRMSVFAAPGGRGCGWEGLLADILSDRRHTPLIILDPPSELVNENETPPATI